MLECTLCAGQTSLHRCGHCIQARYYSDPVPFQHYSQKGVAPSRFISFRLVSSSLGCRVVHSLKTRAAVLCATAMAQPPYDPLPLAGDDLSAIALYNMLPSPDPHLTSFRSAFHNSTERRPRFLAPALHEDLRKSFGSSNNSPTGGPQYTSSLYTINDSGANPYRDDLPSGAVTTSPASQPRFLEEKTVTYPPPPTKSHRRTLLLVVLAALIIVIVAVVVPIYFTIIKSPTNPGSRAVSTSPTESASNATPSQTVTGGAGSLITMEDGTTFIYDNQFGGYWYFDENDPFNDGARAQSWTPALNETFNYGIDKIRG